MRLNCVPYEKFITFLLCSLIDIELCVRMFLMGKKHVVGKRRLCPPGFPFYPGWGPTVLSLSSIFVQLPRGLFGRGGSVTEGIACWI